MKNFCVVPWYSREIDLTTGKENVCCWINKDISRSDLQQKFLSEQPIPECEKCWDSEKRGIESRRQMENRFLDFKMDRDIQLLQDDTCMGNSNINMYQIFMGSTCNSSCVTCGPTASSSWRGLLKNTVSIKQENSRVDKHFKDFADSVDWSGAKRFNLLGGEPLLINQSFDVLRRLVDASNTDCRISFVTNGNIIPTHEQIEILRHFSDINCCVSIDGIGKSFEYIRYPLRWENLQANLKIYREIFTEVNVSFTVSNLNYYDRSNIIQWFQDQKLLYIENYVSFPAWFNHQVDPSHELWPQFVQEIKRQDKLKGINIRDYLPYVADLIDQSC